MDWLFLALLIAAIPFVLPIASWVSARRTRARVEALSVALDDQRATIDQLKTQVSQLRRQMREGSAAPAPDAAARQDPVAAPAQPSPAVVPPIAPPPGGRPPAPVGQQPPVATPPRDEPRPAPAPQHEPEPRLGPPPAPPPVPSPALPPIPSAAAAASVADPERRAPGPTPSIAADAQRPPLRPPRPDAPTPPPPRMPPPAPPEPPAPAFDWESLIGVKLFSAIAGVALVIAAIYFLKYSVEHGWLQPPIRVLIGISVAVALLVVCELRAARKYPATANALDAAAIAILFSTFFAAHALWNLIPSLVTFALLGVVTAVAVLLSIRRESLFIAVLGLLGGFATPALLSSGENRPIPLFAYLMLLNIGLSWVAYRQTWPVLTALTLAFTTIYQWVWVLKFLHQSPLTLAMGVFLMFPIAALAGLMLAKRRIPADDASGADRMFERTAVLAAATPLLFAVYLSAVPAYGDRPWLLFGFLMLVDAGLFAVAITRAQGVLHAAGAMATLVVMGSWLAFSLSSSGAYPGLVSCAAFVTFFALAPIVADFLNRPLDDDFGAEAIFAAPLLLFVLVVLARAVPAFAAPLPLFATLLALVVLIAWRAIATGRGGLYYWAAFFAIATQASWSSVHLSLERLGTAVVIYAVFGVVATAIPVIARRTGRPLTPAAGGGLVLIGSLALLLFLSSGPIAPAALWALALLLAIINAGLFVESGSGGLPVVSIVGSLASWLILGSWWLEGAGVVGILPSLTVLAGLTLLTMGGHAWVHLRSRPASGSGRTLSEGLYLGLIGHLFLLFVAVNRSWSLPPWPWLATLAVLTLAGSTVSLVTRTTALHAAGAIAAGVIVAAWTYATGAPWSLVALIASAAASAFALAWMPIARDRIAPAAAAALLFLGELTALLASLGGAPPFPAVVVAHVANLAVLLALTWAYRWRQVALWAVVPACFAAAVQWQQGDLAIGWTRLLVLAFAMYAVFTAYPIVLGRSGRGERDPYLAAVLASGMFFFAARAALNAGGYRWMVGALPVGEGAVMAILLRQLLSIEAAGERDLGRLALVAGTALAFVTVAIPLQLSHQWWTIGWALEGAALAWLFRRIPHRGLLYTALGLLGAVFVRLALNPEVLRYEPRGELRIFNWYLYAYLICAAAFVVAAWGLSTSDEGIEGVSLRPSQVLPGGAVILLFLLLNIEIADFYATGPSIMFRFGVTVSQDLTYTIGWLVFGMALLAVCIYRQTRFGRVAALALIALTTFKCFLYDLGSLGGLYRVASLVGLAISLALVSLALQKFVFARTEGQT